MPAPLPNRFRVMITSAKGGSRDHVCLVQLDDQFTGRPKFPGKTAAGVKRVIFRSAPLDPKGTLQTAAWVESVARTLNDSRLTIAEIEQHADASRRLRSYVMELYEEVGGK